ncbi:MAG: pilus assembly protein PilP [Georgfuchsia sp.]
MKQWNRILIGFAAAIFSLLLAGCGNDDHGDVRAWMLEASKDLRGHVPDLPQIKPLDVKPYEPGDMISPFSSEKVVSGGLVGGTRVLRSGGPAPLNPDSYPLTKAPLEAIRFVGTIIVDKDVRALVQVEREPVRQVRIGEYMGQNYGRVQRITPASDDSSGHVLLKEKLFDKGVWVERDTVFPAQGKGDRK